MSNKVYLGCNGRAFGPFSESEIETLQAEGTFSQFHWIWDDSSRVWQALDPAPAPIITKAGITKDLPGGPIVQAVQVVPVAKHASAPIHRPEPIRAPEPEHIPEPEPIMEPIHAEPVAPPAPIAPVIPLRPRSQATGKPYKEKVFQALCHNQSTVVSGNLRQYADNEAELVSDDHSSAPSLPTTIPVLVNLLDEKSGKQSSLQATVTHIKRGSQGWHYTLRFSESTVQSA